MKPKRVMSHTEKMRTGSSGVRAGARGQYDVHQRQLRGNLPQGFVHAGLLECAVRLSPDVRLGA